MVHGSLLLKGKGEKSTSLVAWHVSIGPWCAGWHALFGCLLNKLRSLLEQGILAEQREGGGRQ